MIVVASGHSDELRIRVFRWLSCRRGDCTFCFTDIEGSTAMLARLGRGAYALVLNRHREILRRAWVSHGGAEVSTDGDSFFVAFSDPRRRYWPAQLGNTSWRRSGGRRAARCTSEWACIRVEPSLMCLETTRRFRFTRRPGSPRVHTGARWSLPAPPSRQPRKLALR